MMTLDDVRFTIAMNRAEACCEMARLSPDDDLVADVLEEISYATNLLVKAALAPDDPFTPLHFAC